MDKDALKNMTVAELRKLAKEIPDAKGISAMKKDDLVELLAKASPDAAAEPKEAAKSAKQKPGAKADPLSDKSEIKHRIQALKEEKREALSQEDRAKAKECNRQIHDLKRKLRRIVRDKASKKK